MDICKKYNIGYYFVDDSITITESIDNLAWALYKIMKDTPPENTKEQLKAFKIMEKITNQEELKKELKKMEEDGRIEKREVLFEKDGLKKEGAYEKK